MINFSSEFLVTAKQKIIKAIPKAKSTSNDLELAFSAWLLSPEKTILDVQILIDESSKRIGAEKTYQEVAILGFAAATDSITRPQKIILSEGIDWLIGRAVFVDGIPTGVCVDPLGLLGIALGIKHLSEELQSKAINWIESFLPRSFSLRGLEDWQKCLFCAVSYILDLKAPIDVPKQNRIAGLRIALLSKGLLPIESSDEFHKDMEGFIKELNSLDTEIELPNLVVTLAALNSVQKQIAIGETIQLQKDEKMIKILFLASSPKNQSQLKLDQEVKAIDERLRKSEYRDHFHLDQQWGVRIEDIAGFFMRYNPDIVHFSGHGNTNSEIILEDKNGISTPVPVPALKKLFLALKDNIKCVVLNACFSEQQANAIAENIDCVVGMSDSISDSAAIKFAASFYEALGYGRNIQTAFDLACIAIEMEKLNEEDTPQLISQNSDPSKVVFI